MYLKSLEATLSVYRAYRIHKTLLLYVPPVLLVLGTLGNVLTAIILTRRAMRTVSSYTYLTVLSVTDTLVLYVGLLRLWIGELKEYDVRDMSDWICKTINVFGYTVSDYSVWLIIAVTVERFIAVCHPLKAPTMCNRTRAVKVIISIGFIILAINFHFFFTAQIRVTEVEEVGKEISQCNAAEGFDQLFKVWHFVDAFIYSFLPFIILSVLNGLIIHKVILAKRNRNMLSGSVTQNNRPGQSSSHRHSEGSARLTVMLLTISFAFVITTLPMNINLILNFYWSSLADKLSDTEQFELFTKATLVRTITELLMYTNHSMNFFLYCATGHKFRHELFQLLQCWKKQTANRPITSHNTSCVTRFTNTGLPSHQVENPQKDVSGHYQHINNKHGI